LFSFSGLLYSTGHGCDRDGEQAWRWLQRAKRRGFEPARSVSGKEIPIEKIVEKGAWLVWFEKTNRLQTGLDFSHLTKILFQHLRF
jgi:hypothetical protein